MDFFTKDYSYTPEVLEVMDRIEKPINKLINWELDSIEKGICTQAQGISEIYLIIRRAVMREELPEEHIIYPQIKEIYTVFYELACKGYTEDFLYCVGLMETNADIGFETIQRGLKVRKARREEILRKAGKLK